MQRSIPVLGKLLAVSLLWTFLAACSGTDSGTDSEPRVFTPDSGRTADTGTSSSGERSSSSESAGGESSSPDLEQCRRRFLEAATKNDSVWWGLRCTIDGEVTYGFECSSEYEIEQFFVDLRPDGTYFLNYRYYPDFQNNPSNFGGFCRIPRTRQGLEWEMADCNTARLYTGCGDTELLEIQGDIMRYDSRHGYVELQRWKRENLTIKFPHDPPFEVGGCYDDAKSAEPRCAE